MTRERELRMLPMIGGVVGRLPTAGVLVVVAITANPFVSALAIEVDLTPGYDPSRVLENPDKGWYHHAPDNGLDKYLVEDDQDLLAIPGMDHVYMRLAWSYLEPSEGQYDWEVIDRDIRRWTAQGLGISFRISCRETTAEREEQQYATPRWVAEAGVPGGHYLRGEAVGPEGPWEPVFDDPLYLEKLEAFIEAFAKRYDGKSWLRYVDIGSIGDYGEGHTWGGSHTRYDFDQRKLHVDLYLRHFKETQLVISDDFVYETDGDEGPTRMNDYVVQHGVTYRDDSPLVRFFITPEVSETFGVRSPEMFEGVYQDRPTIFELEHYSIVRDLGNWTPRPGSLLAKYGGGLTGPDVFRGALDRLHSTYIGYHGDAKRWYQENPQLTGQLLNRCGYWFFPQSLETAEAWAAGAEEALKISWENRGVAPAYTPYTVQLCLESDHARRILDLAGMDSRKWASDQVTPDSGTVALPADLPQGDYRLSLRLWSTTHNRPVEIGLKETLRDPEGFYYVTTIPIK